MIKFNGLNHLAMATGDMTGTVRFWRDLIGMRLVAAMGEPGFKQYIFEMSSRDLLVFFEWPGILPINEKGHGTPSKGPLGFDHLSIGVEGADDLFELKDKLNASDIWVSEVIDHGFIHSIYTYDPNGIAVEFSCLCKTSGIDIRKTPLFTDKCCCEAAQEGPEPNPAAWPAVQNPTKEEERRIYPGDFFFME